MLRSHASLLLGLGLLALAGCQQSPLRGSDSAGWTVTLRHPDGTLATAEEADAVLLDVHDALKRGQDWLDRTVPEVWRDDVAAGRSTHVKPEWVEAAARLPLPAARWRWEPRTFDGEGVLGGTRSWFDGMRTSSPTPALATGQRIDLALAVQAIAWPRKAGYTEHPEILLGQAEVTWWGHEVELCTLPGTLADALAREVARLIASRAEARGLQAHLRGPQGHTIEGATGPLVAPRDD